MRTRLLWSNNIEPLFTNLNSYVIMDSLTMPWILWFHISYKYVILFRVGYEYQIYFLKALAFSLDVYHIYPKTRPRVWKFRSGFHQVRFSTYYLLTPTWIWMYSQKFYFQSHSINWEIITCLKLINRSFILTFFLRIWYILNFMIIIVYSWGIRDKVELFINIYYIVSITW